MILKNGITGFHMSYKDITGTNDSQQFKKTCFEIAERNSGKIRVYNFSLLEKNFYFAECDINHKEVYILLNAYYPYLAFAANIDFENINFMNNKFLNNKSLSHYEILTVKGLNDSYIKITTLNELSGAQIGQINYWKPDTIG